jgi:hypothetical protein
VAGPLVVEDTIATFRALFLASGCYRLLNLKQNIKGFNKKKDISLTIFHRKKARGT